MPEPTVTIGLKEIYTELLRTSKAVDNLSTRVEKIEVSLADQEKEHRNFRRSVTLQVFGSILAILVGAISFILYK